MSRRLPATALAFGLAIATVAIPTAALGHAQLVSASPAPNATVAAPTRIALTFNEPLIAPTVKVQLVMTGMPGMTGHPAMPVKVAAPSLGKDRRTVAIQPQRPLGSGTYRLTWWAAGADTHRKTGSYSFTVR